MCLQCCRIYEGSIQHSKIYENPHALDAHNRFSWEFGIISFHLCLFFLSSYSFLLLPRSAGPSSYSSVFQFLS